MELQTHLKKMNYSAFTGHWENPFQDTKGISDFDLIEKNGTMSIHVRGVEDGLIPGDWGSAPVIGHAKAPDATEAIALQATFNQENRVLFLAININKGLIIIAAYIRFKEEGKPSNFFIREFFHKQ